MTLNWIKETNRVRSGVYSPGNAGGDGTNWTELLRRESGQTRWNPVCNPADGRDSIPRKILSIFCGLDGWIRPRGANQAQMSRKIETSRWDPVRILEDGMLFLIRIRFRFFWREVIPAHSPPPLSLSLSLSLSLGNPRAGSQDRFQESTTPWNGNIITESRLRANPKKGTRQSRGYLLGTGDICRRLSQGPDHNKWRYFSWWHGGRERERGREGGREGGGEGGRPSISRQEWPIATYKPRPHFNNRGTALKLSLYCTLTESSRPPHPTPLSPTDGYAVWSRCSRCSGC